MNRQSSSNTREKNQHDDRNGQDAVKINFNGSASKKIKIVRSKHGQRGMNLSLGNAGINLANIKQQRRAIIAKEGTGFSIEEPKAVQSTQFNRTINMSGVNLKKGPGYSTKTLNISVDRDNLNTFTSPQSIASSESSKSREASIRVRIGQSIGSQIPANFYPGLGQLPANRITDSITNNSGLSSLDRSSDQSNNQYIKRNNFISAQAAEIDLSNQNIKRKISLNQRILQKNMIRVQEPPQQEQTLNSSGHWTMMQQQNTDAKKLVLRQKKYSQPKVDRSQGLVSNEDHHTPKGSQQLQHTLQSIFGGKKRKESGKQAETNNLNRSQPISNLQTKHVRNFRTHLIQSKPQNQQDDSNSKPIPQLNLSSLDAIPAQQKSGRDASNSQRESAISKTINSARQENANQESERSSQLQPQVNISDVKFPITPAKCLKFFKQQLTEYEKHEILDFPSIYYIGQNSQKKTGGSPQQEHNLGFDDSKGNYKINVNDHIGYRYEILQFLGKGSFGIAIKCFDHKKKEEVALKVIKNKKKYYYQAGVELKILQYLKDNDPEDTMNIIHMKDYVIFRKHLCITFELLSINLYEFLKLNDFEGLSLSLVRRFAIQLLYALKYLQEHDVIHCDLKPENILLKDPTKSGIKIIDFGSSCFEDERVYTYIQSRFYRAPEIILGIPYKATIDMWSFGCMMAEFCIGYPLFPGEDEMEQLQLIMEVCGVPPQDVLSQSQRKKKFFSDDNNPNLVANSRGKTRRPGTKNLEDLLDSDDQNFLHFVERCLDWNPETRMSPDEALRHVWILEGLPPKVLVHHQKLHGIKTHELPQEIQELRTKYINEEEKAKLSSAQSNATNSIVSPRTKKIINFSQERKQSFKSQKQIIKQQAIDDL